MTVYEMSKQVIAQQKPLDPIEFSRTISKVAKKMEEKNFWMLLCRERNDYSIFQTEDAKAKKIQKELIPTLSNRGQVVYVEAIDDNGYEIWIRDIGTKEDFAYLLFDYTYGMIDCR